MPAVWQNDGRTGPDQKHSQKLLYVSSMKALF